MEKFKITFISDTHTLHKQLNEGIGEGDILIHAGDSTSRGFKEEIKSFLKWLERCKYEHLIFIAGNHDWCFQDSAEYMKEILEEYPLVDYLQDSWLYIPYNNEDFENKNLIKVYGSPWQPEFCNWAFNLPRVSPELETKWSLISENTDILITHGPPYDILDLPAYSNSNHVGCELLLKRVKELKPKIHVFGHIHGSYGYKFDGHTHFLNASVLNEEYKYANKPLKCEWTPETNELIFL